MTAASRRRRASFRRFAWRSALPRLLYAVASSPSESGEESLTSIAAFLGISIALYFGPGYEAADDWAALFAAGVIAFNGVRLFRGAWREVLDVAPPPEVLGRVRATAAAVEGVVGIDKCRVRKSGLGMFIDIHVEVDGDLSVRDGHELGHRVKNALVASPENVHDVLVHIEPSER